jgi:hypothetical protein
MAATTDADAPSTTASNASTERSWRGVLVRSGVAYVLSRLCVMAGAGIVAAQQVADQRADPNFVRPGSAVTLITKVLTSWDGAWYYEVIRHGYPKVVPPNVTFFIPEARAAFFPAFPLLVRWADHVLPGGDVFAGIIVNFLLGALFVYLVGLLARAQFGQRIAYRAMIIAAFFPGSFVLSFTYSEALLLCAAAGCLLALRKHQWLLAGILAALGTAARPNGLALCAACAVAAFIAIRQRREWMALIAPVLSPLGVAAFQIYLRVHTGEWAWFRVQREAWHEGNSFGLTAIKNTYKAFVHPLASPTQILTAISFLAALFLVWVMWRRRLPWPDVTYTAVVLALMILPNTVTARPRFLFTAFPALIALAAWWPEEHDDAWTATVAMGAAGLAVLTGLYGVLGAIP